MKKQFFFSFITLVAFCLGTVSRAETNRFSILTNITAFLADDYIITQGSTPAETGKFFLSSRPDYAYRPMELTQNGARVSGVIDRTLVEHFGLGLGLKKDWDLGLNLPIVWHNRFNAPTNPQPGFENRVGIGELLLRTRARILNNKKSFLGLAFSGFVTFPTGDDDAFMANPSMTGGFSILADKTFNRHFSLSQNLGLIFRDEVNYQDYASTTLITASQGLRYNMTNNWQLLSDLTFQTPTEHFCSSAANTSVELFLLTRYEVPHTNFVVGLGGAKSLAQGVGTPEWRVLGEISFKANIRQD